jgi:hypothetical protein
VQAVQRLATCWAARGSKFESRQYQEYVLRIGSAANSASYSILSNPVILNVAHLRRNPFNSSKNGYGFSNSKYFCGGNYRHIVNNSGLESREHGRRDPSH